MPFLILCAAAFVYCYACSVCWVWLFIAMYAWIRLINTTFIISMSNYTGARMTFNIVGDAIIQLERVIRIITIEAHSQYV